MTNTSRVFGEAGIQATGVPRPVEFVAHVHTVVGVAGLCM